MLKMRVSLMRVTKTSPTPAQRRKEAAKNAASPRQTPERHAVRARMEKVATQQMARLRSAGSAIRRRYGPGRPRRAQKAAQAKGGGGWRQSMAAQACVCGVILLSVLGFRALDTPLTNRITDGLSQVVTMEADIGKDLGRLRFVRDIVPESVLTFWESTGEGITSLYAPMDGEVVLSFSSSQPGILIAGPSQDVRCAADGVVISVKQGQEGDYVLRVEHEGGIETVYALLQGVKVAAGDTVKRGQEVALAMPTNTGAQVYFQALQKGTPFDPMTLFEQR